MGDRYVLGFAPAPRFLLSKNVVHTLQTSLSETLKRGPPRQGSREGSVNYGDTKIMETLKSPIMHKIYDSNGQILDRRSSMEEGEEILLFYGRRNIIHSPILHFSAPPSVPAPPPSPNPDTNFYFV